MEALLVQCQRRSLHAGLSLLFLFCALPVCDAAQPRPEDYGVCDGKQILSCTGESCFCNFDSAPVSPYGCISSFTYNRGTSAWESGANHQICLDDRIQATYLTVSFLCAAYLPGPNFCAACGAACCRGVFWADCRAKCCGRCIGNPNLAQYPGETNVCPYDRYVGGTVCTTTCKPGENPCISARLSSCMDCMR